MLSQFSCACACVNIHNTETYTDVALRKHRARLAVCRLGTSDALSLASTESGLDEMGKRKFEEFLPDECHRRYCCVHCRAHLANHDELISKVCLSLETVACC